MGEETVLAFRRYQKTRGLARATIDRRDVSLKGFAAYIAPLELAEGEPDLIDDWLGTFTSPATRRAYLLCQDRLLSCVSSSAIWPRTSGATTGSPGTRRGPGTGARLIGGRFPMDVWGRSWL